MASATKRPNGHWWIQYCWKRRRHTLYFPAMAKRQAETIRNHVERLLVAQKGTPIEPGSPTAEWLEEISDDWHQKLSRKGLVPARTVPTIGELCKLFRQSLDVAVSTRQNVSVVLGNLRTRFEADTPVRIVSNEDAKKLRSWMLQHGGVKGGPLAETTVSRRIGRCREVFEHAKKLGWIASNPFEQEKRGDESNRSKDHWISPDVARAVLAEIGDREFRAIFALARFGGLRCPSEVRPLTWQAVNWDRREVRVFAQKTERIRFVVMSPDLHEALQALWEVSPDGSTLLFPRHQFSGTALTNRLRQACHRAGVGLWQKPWQNLRASRATELKDLVPAHVAADQLGHSEAIARKHYDQVLPAHRALISGQSDPKRGTPESVETR